MRRSEKWPMANGPRSCLCGCGLQTPLRMPFGKSYNAYATRQCSVRAYQRSRPITESRRAYHKKATNKWWIEKGAARREAQRAEARRARGWHPYGTKRSRWAAALEKKHGMTTGDFHRMVISQSGLCLICSGQMKVPNVDHCHATGAVRGLLCHQCNKGLGQFGDDQQLLIEAIRYLGDARRNALKLA